MALVKRSAMTLFSLSDCIHCHRIRIALAEKNIQADIFYVNPDQPPEDLLDLNPYGNVPTLMDRDLVINHAGIILEYLDERFPHPPLLPVYPVLRARMRLMIECIEQEWYTAYALMKKKSTQATKDLIIQYLTKVIPMFKEYDYFLHDTYSLVDASVAPFLWRLHHIGIDLNDYEQLAPLLDYEQRVFERHSFEVSLSEVESEMRDVVLD